MPSTSTIVGALKKLFSCKVVSHATFESYVTPLPPLCFRAGTVIEQSESGKRAEASEIRIFVYSRRSLVFSGKGLHYIYIRPRLQSAADAVAAEYSLCRMRSVDEDGPDQCRLPRVQSIFLESSPVCLCLCGIRFPVPVYFAFDKDTDNPVLFRYITDNKSITCLLYAAAK